MRAAIPSGRQAAPAGRLARRRWLVAASGGVVAGACAWLLPAAPVRAGATDEVAHAIAVDDGRALAALLARGADPNTLDERGQVALYAALRDGSPRCVQVLLAARDLKVDAVNAAGETPLMMAALRGNEEAVAALLARGAAAHRPGWSPLHYAASGGSVPLVRLFLARGAPVDAQAPGGATPLMMAARYGGSDAAEVLLEAGADRTLVNDQGRDAAAEALAGGLDGVARWLREWRRPKATSR
jgi:hypothetical protein